MGSMQDDRLDELIRRTLAESRKPPAPPLDEMWMRIEQRAFDEPRSRRALHAYGRGWRLTSLAAAAALVMGTGLGWYIAPRSVTTLVVPSPASETAQAQPVAATPLFVPPATRSGSESKGNTAAIDAGAQSASAQSHNLAVTTARTVAPPGNAYNMYAHDMTDAGTARLALQFSDAGNESSMSRYLVRTAALLAALPSDRTATESDTAVATRAGELLTQTHLMLDSQAGSDPTLHKLLEDLELVLAQVARLRGSSNGPDLQLIHQALAVHDVIPRVHDATVEASITE